MTQQKQLKRWLEFEEWEEFNKTHKTKKFSVKSKCSGHSLGYIQWHNGWRHYCFFPFGQTFHSDRCLMEISEFITKLNLERKKLARRY